MSKMGDHRIETIETVDLELRDHSQPCEHGLKFAHQPSKADGYGWCPGGRKIVMRREWRCLQGEAYGGPCTPEEWADMDPNPVWVNYPLRHRDCGYVWVEVSDK